MRQKDLDAVFLWFETHPDDELAETYQYALDMLDALDRGDIAVRLEKVLGTKFHVLSEEIFDIMDETAERILKEKCQKS